MHVAVTFLSHSEILGDPGGTLLSEISNLALRSEFLLTTAGHELTNQIVLVVETLFITKEDGL